MFVLRVVQGNLTRKYRRDRRVCSYVQEHHITFGTMADEFDYSLFGDILVKPSTGESETPVNVLKNKVVSWLGSVFELS